MCLKKIQLEHLHKKLNAKMISFAGFSMPLYYEGIVREHNQVRNNVGIFDVSHMGQIFIEGEEATNLIQKVSSNDINLIETNGVQYSYLPNQKGGVIDDLLIYKFHINKYMLVVNASNIKKDYEWIKYHNKFKANVMDLSNEFSLFSIQGPNSLKILNKLLECNLEKLDYYKFCNTKSINNKNILVSNTGYTGSMGFEIYINNIDAESIWSLIFELGKNSDIKPIGLGARDSLRLEMGYCLYGNELTDEISPFESGLGWITKIETNFINSKNLKLSKENGLKRKKIGFIVMENKIARKGFEIFTNEDDKKIGHVTSGIFSPTLNKSIGLAIVDINYSSLGEHIYILIRNKKILAEIVSLPFYKAND